MSQPKPNKKFHVEVPHSQRLGQAICNAFNITNAELFYTKDGDILRTMKAYAEKCQKAVIQ